MPAYEIPPALPVDVYLCLFLWDSGQRGNGEEKEDGFSGKEERGTRKDLIDGEAKKDKIYLEGLPLDGIFENPVY